MIRKMDMTTGQWEFDYMDTETLSVSGKSAPANLSVHAGLHEYEIVQPLDSGMPVAVAMQDVGKFLIRMAVPDMD